LSSFNDIENLDLESSPSERSRLAVASLVCSLIICCPLVTIFGPILGVVAFFKMKREPHLSGKGFAVSGILIGAITTIIWILVSMFLVKVFVNFVEQTRAVSTQTIQSGYDGCYTCFRENLTPTSALVTDEEIQSFIETLEERYGTFDSAFLNMEEQNQNIQPTQRETPIPIRFVFETTDVTGFIMFEILPSSFYEFGMKIECIKIEDTKNGDIIFPLDSACSLAPAPPQVPVNDS